MKKLFFALNVLRSNQRYVSSVQHKDEKKTYKTRTSFGKSNNICSACNYFQRKKKIDWKLRETIK